METEVKELANILDVPILTAGVFPYSNQKQGQPPVRIAGEEIDRIIRGSNLLQPIIKEAIKTGIYRGSDYKNSNKPIPGLLNLHHQALFPQSKILSDSLNETLKEAVKNISVSFHKKAIPNKNGILEEWVVERFHNVPDEIATTLAIDFPIRSAELIPLTDPNTGESFPHVIRSTAFLDRYTSPAVKGQNPELIVEFAGQDDPLLIITTHQNIGGHDMAEKAQDLTNVAELAAMQATLTEQKTLIDGLNAKIDSVEGARQEAVELAIQNEKAKDAKITELQAAQDIADSDKIISGLSGKVRKYGDQMYMVSPAFLDTISPSIKNKGVIELAEGENLRQKYAEMFESVIDLAGKHAILVPIETQGLQNHAEPGGKEKALIDQATELAAKEEISYGDAWVKVMGNQKGGE